MDKAKKRLASAFDGLRFNISKLDISVEERLQPEHCRFSKVVRHGFPDDAKCLAYDPMQRLLAIGSGHGHVRILGDAGVDYLLRHETEQPVNHMQFLINEGGLITACGADMIHLWNYRQKVPEIVHSLQLNKESVTAIHLPLSSKWLHVGTDKGNVYFVSVGTFQMSPYIINWNKAIDLSCRVHPGAVRQIVANPVDPSKLLILFDKGVLIQWCLTTKEVDRFPLDPPVKSVSWHYDGRQLITGNIDGSVCVYNIKKPSEPVQKSTPHGQGQLKAIPIIDWKHTNDGEQVIIFAGGMPSDDGLPALTILRAARSATVMEMESTILSFVTLTQMPYNSCPQQPHAVAVLLKNDLMMIDLQSAGYPCIESPHAMDLHEPPITALAYYSNCPSDLIGALTLVGCKQRKKGLSEKPWPATGGVARECATGHQELVVTGHKDGSVRFWQASGEALQMLYRLKTGSHFERREEMEGCDKVSHAVKLIELCLESRLLLIAGVSGQVTLFRFTKSESTTTIAVVNIPLLGQNVGASTTVLDDKSNSSNSKEMKRQRKVMSRDSTNSPDTSDASCDEKIVPFKVRGAPVKRPAGYQAELACLVPWSSQLIADSVTAMALNSAFGVIAIGTSSGLALVDISQCALIYAWSTSELYGSDPTPAIQLNTQFSEASSPTVENSPEPPTDGLLAADSTIVRKKSGNVVNVIRRNTAEFAASIRERYAGSASPSPQPDRPSVDDVRSPSPEPTSEHRAAGRSHSVKDSIMRKLTKKGTNIARSLSFHSHISEESDRDNTPRDSPSLARNNAHHSSPSNSTNSLERIGGNEGVTSLTFIVSSSKRNDPKTYPCLWVGTSAGTSIALNLILPQDRLISTVVVAPSGTVVKLKGQVLLQSFMDQCFCLNSAASESYRETSKESKDSSTPEHCISNKILTKPSLSPVYTTSVDYSEEVAQVLVVVSEWEVKVVALPSFSQLFSHKCDEVPLVKAQTTHVRGHPAVVCLTAAGQLLVLSLPSLRPLLLTPFVNCSLDIDDPLCQKTVFSEHALGIYMASPSEVEKFTVCNDLAEQTTEAMGELFVACDMPETPKSSSFLKGVSSIFNSSPRPADGNELDILLNGGGENNKNSGSTPGASMRSVARTIPGPAANMERAQAGGVSAGQAAMMAMQNLHERGDKLNAVVDATENLKNNAMNMASRSSKLVEKYEKKKWYNF